MELPAVNGSFTRAGTRGRRLGSISIVASALAIGMGMANCTEPPIGYIGAGRTTTLPDLVGDSGGSTGLCAPDGVICHTDADCCGSHTCNGYCQDCTGGSCKTAPQGAPLCAPDGIICTLSSDCCDSYCSGNGVCGDLPGNTCAPDSVACFIDELLPGPGGSCCNPCTKGATTPCNTCTPTLGCTGPNFNPTESAPLCVPIGVYCSPGPTPAATPCCAGTCYYNESLESVCALAP
jgi:hypothetical protein